MVSGVSACLIDECSKWEDNRCDWMSDEGSC